MKCPVCEVPLSITSREGVEIDFCPQCRGVWLDRGELDKIIDRAGAIAAVPTGGVGDDERWRGDDRRGYDRGDDRRGYDRGYDPRDHRKRKRRSFLEDLFDFD